MKKKSFTLTDGEGRHLQVRATARYGCLEISPEGYGDPNSQPGEGSPVILDWSEGKLTLYVWTDINDTAEEPLALSISLEAAREDKKKEG